MEDNTKRLRALFHLGYLHFRDEFLIRVDLVNFLINKNPEEHNKELKKCIELEAYQEKLYHLSKRVKSRRPTVEIFELSALDIYTTENVHPISENELKMLHDIIMYCSIHKSLWCYCKLIEYTR